MASLAWAYCLSMYVVLLIQNSTGIQNQIPLSKWREILRVKDNREFIERFAQPRIPQVENRPQSLPDYAFGPPPPYEPFGSLGPRPGEQLEDDLILREREDYPLESDILKEEEDIVNSEENEVIKVMYSETGSIDPDGTALIASQLATAAPCEPTMQTVEIPNTYGGLNIYYPQCTRMLRCGGCCGHNALECVPSVAEVVTLKVLHAKLPYESAVHFEIIGYVQVALERHVACECRCKKQPHHCNMDVHYYDFESCECKCKNGGFTCTEGQVWDENSCQCVCSQRYPCMTTEQYNNYTCRCEPRQTRATFRDSIADLSSVRRDNYENETSTETTTTKPTTTTTTTTVSTTVRDCTTYRCLPGYVAVQHPSFGCNCVIPEIHYAQTQSTPARQRYVNDRLPESYRPYYSGGRTRSRQEPYAMRSPDPLPQPDVQMRPLYQQQRDDKTASTDLREPDVPVGLAGARDSDAARLPLEKGPD